MCNSGVFSITDGEADKFSRLGVSKVLFIFDMDSDMSNSEVLSVDDIRKKVSIVEGVCNKHNMLMQYVPVVYCAETIAIYQFYNGNRRLSDMVNKVNTKLLNVNILKLLTGVHSSKKLKRYDYVDYEALRVGLIRANKIDKFNACCLKFLIGGECIGYSGEDIILFIELMYKHYHDLLKSDKPMRVSYRGKNLEVFTDEYKQQLRDFGVNISNK